MKANELMIGDWVNIMIDGYDNPVQIKEIGKFWVKVTQDDKDYGVILVQPILLTSEILEKNGFEKALQISDTEPFDTDEEGNKHYSYNKTFWGWWQSDNIFCIPANGLGWLNIKYVHELQHALRLCGIEKEIIL